MATKNGWLAAVLMVGMAVGCGEGGSSGATPSSSQKSQAQNAGTASSTVAKTEEAATSAVVESGAPGSTSAKSQKSYAAGTTINYQASVTVTVDLNGLNGAGQDAYPNAEGTFTVTANGSVVGDGMNGQVTYDVHVKWDTDGIFTDPACGTTATIAAGSNWNYSLVIQWAKTDDLNWSISATADVNGALNATVVHDGTTWTVTGTVTRHAALSLKRENGNYSFTFGIHGNHTVVVTNGIEIHTVVTTMSALDHIVIEVDGVKFGPYTLAQVLWWWAFHCNP